MWQGYSVGGTEGLGGGKQGESAAHTALSWDTPAAGWHMAGLKHTHTGGWPYHLSPACQWAQHRLDSLLGVLHHSRGLRCKEELQAIRLRCA